MSLLWGHFSKACSLGFQPQIFVTLAFERKLIKTLFVFDTLGSLHKVIELGCALARHQDQEGHGGVPYLPSTIVIEYSLLQSWNAFPPRTIWWGSPPRAEKRKMYHIIRSFDKVWKGRLRRCGRRFRRSASSITLLHLKTESETPFSYTCMSTPEKDAFFVPE